MLDEIMREFERRVEEWVERDFETARLFPDRFNVVRDTGDFYDPHAPREQLVALKQRVIRAQCARHRFSYEPKDGAQCDLPLTFSSCQWMAGQRDERYRRVGRFALWLRELEWHYQLPFPEFCKREQTDPLSLVVHRPDEGQDSNIIPFRPQSGTEPPLD